MPELVEAVEHRGVHTGVELAREEGALGDAHATNICPPANTVRDSPQLDSQNLTTVKQLWRVLEEDGLSASMDALLQCAHEDVELTPYAAEGRTFHGAEEVRDFYRRSEAAGASYHASAWSFEETGDCVYVTGSIRVHRPDGSIADAQLRWSYEFRDGLVACAKFGPLSGRNGSSTSAA